MAESNNKRMQQKYYWIVGIVVLLVIVIGFFVVVINFSQQNNDGKEENTVFWNEAIRILNGGEVEKIAQAHSLDVTLILKDGRKIKTKEPGIDDIFDEVEKCGEPCKEILLFTE